MLATPVMINVIEAAALAAVEHLLPAGHQSLGIHLDVSHTAATPIGLRVTATAEVVRLEGRTVTFRVDARDEFEPIGGGSSSARGRQRGAVRRAGAAQGARHAVGIQPAARRNTRSSTMWSASRQPNCPMRSMTAPARC